MGQETESDGARRYGTVEGVFVPTLLTILGVILYLRTGWVVGNAGLLGALGIITVAFLVTGLTALSLASMSTNVAPGAGGAYALVSRSFGVEAGGAVGLPLYLSQSLVIVLYVFGFREGWQAAFGPHPALLIDVAMVVVLVTVALISTKAAFRTQFVILGIVAVSLVAVVVAVVTGDLDQRPPLTGDFPGAPEEGFPGVDVWAVFAVFFPATTGIMAGLNLSGELRDPRRSILRGTLAAVGVSLAVYLGVAVWLAFAAPMEELAGNYLVMAERSAWAPAVIAGLLAATFSSALASLVGAPRILQALAEHRVPPGASWLARRDGRGEPRNALVVTIVVVAAALLARDLNAIAPLITMVFLVTYAAINIAVLVETVIDLPSYRPTFAVPWPVPLLGTVGCIAGMLVIHAWLAVVALLTGLGFVLWLTRRNLARPVTDIRSAALLALARWASRKAREVRSSEERTWSAHLLAPVTSLDDLERACYWLPHLAEEGGPAKLVAISGAGGAPAEEFAEALRSAVEELTEAGLQATSTIIEVDDAARGPAATLRAVGTDESQSANMIVTAFPEEADQDAGVRRLLREAFDRDIGVVLTPPDLEGPPDGDDGDDGEEDAARISLWVHEQGPRWEVEDHLYHSDLALLLAQRLVGAWNADLRLITAVADADDVEPAEGYLRELAEVARLPGPPEAHVVQRPFVEAIGDATGADLHVLALSSQVDFDALRRLRGPVSAPCLFVRDSGVENAYV